MDYQKMTADCDARHDALTLKRMDMDAALAQLKDEQAMIRGEYRLLKRLEAEAAKAKATETKEPCAPPVA
jgi:hypothetical protein